VALDLSPGLGQALLEVLHHGEAVEGDADLSAEHLLGRFDVAVPHVGGHLLQEPQHPALLGRREPSHQRLLVPALQHLQHLSQLGPVLAFKPMACYNPAGDCIEFLVSNEPYYAKRMDGWVTVYYSEE